MKILVNATAMDARGAFSVMNSFLIEMNNHFNDFKDYGIKMHFLAANENLCKYSNEFIKVEYTSFAKKSWFHKWKYERKIIPELFAKSGFDAYLSMQNYVLNNISAKQFVLMHQPIPFSDLKYSDLEFINWLKYNVIFKYLLRKQRNSVTGVIVQTEWMKEAIIKKFCYTCPVKVVRPPVDDINNNNKPIDHEIEKLFKTVNKKLLYPTNIEKYKNNQRLIQAIQKYNLSSKSKVDLFLTLEGKSTDHIKYIGKIPYESILTLYKSIDAIIFPSLTETLGLPLMEAMIYNIPVIAADLPYAREVCGEYGSYFNPRDIDSICNAVSEYISGDCISNISPVISNASYFDYIKFIIESTQK